MGSLLLGPLFPGSRSQDDAATDTLESARRLHQRQAGLTPLIQKYDGKPR
jgi:hypothetical protein